MLPLLRSQVESLAAELDASPHGLLDDYPGQCNPVDIVPAIAAIRRADAVLGTDHAEFAERAIRGCQRTCLGGRTGLPAYVVSWTTGKALDSARGVGLSFMLIWVPELWPETAQQWYRAYQDQFWQEDRWFAGFREYPKGIDVGWFTMNDVDAGPVIGGYGMGASAFGVGAVRTMGDKNRAWKLAAEGLVAAWPLPHGTLLVPRLLSYFSDAPYLGEAATLFALTRPAVLSTKNSVSKGLPGVVYLGVSVLLCLGGLEILLSLRGLAGWHRQASRYYVPIPRIQMGIWVVLLGATTLTWFTASPSLALVLLLTAQVLPRRLRRHSSAAETDAA